MKGKTILSFMTVVMLGTGFGTAFADDFPKGYPFSFWGKAGTGDRSLAVGRFEQGVEMGVSGDWSLVPFVAFGMSKSSVKEDYWDNCVMPEFGVKVTHPFRPMGENAWGSISVGVRRRFEAYFESAVDDLSETEAFIQIGFGGDWK